jgi:hypothetical protein
VYYVLRRLGPFFILRFRHFSQNSSQFHFQQLQQHPKCTKISTMVDLEGPLPHSVAASLHKVSSSCSVDCRLMLTPRGGSECFVMFHCHWPSYCFCTSHHFLLLNISPMISRASKETRGKFESFVLDLVATTSSLTHPNLLNLLFCVQRMA